MLHQDDDTYLGGTIPRDQRSGITIRRVFNTNFSAAGVVLEANVGGSGGVGHSPSNFQVRLT